MKKKIYQFVVFIIFSILSVHSIAQSGLNWREIDHFKLPSCDTHITGGGSVSVKGNLAIVGKTDDCFDQFGGNLLDWAGAAFIYELDNNGNWIQKQKIVSQDRTYAAQFGNSVSIFGDFAVIGASHDSHYDANNNFLQYAGAVYIFKRDNTGIWNQFQKIVASDGATDTCFGISVSIFDEYVIVSSSSTGSLIGSGEVYFYEFDINSETWIEQNSYSPPDATSNDEFGNSVSMSGDFAAVGAPNYNQDIGSVYTFKKDINGVFQYDQRIDNNFMFSVGGFGYSVSVDGNTALIGAPWIMNSEDASAHFYERDSLTGNWTLVKSVMTPTLISNNYYSFGFAVALSGNNAVIGCPFNYYPFQAGYAFLYKKISGVWSDNPQLLNGKEQENDDWYGYFVSISGNYCFVSSSGVTYFDPSGEIYYTDGAYYIFRQCDTLIANAGNNSQICKGQIVTLGGNSQNPTAQGGLPPYTYSWYTIPPSSWSSTLENPVVQPDQTTTYFLTVTDLAGNGITATSEVTVRVRQNCPCIYPITFDKNLVEPCLSTNAEGNVVLTGEYSDKSISFGNINYGFYSIVDNNPLNYQRIFVGKFTDKGIMQWAHSISCVDYYPYYEYKKIIVDNENNTFLVLYTREKFFLEEGQELGSNNVNPYISVIKFDPFGSVEWVKIFEEPNSYPKAPEITSSNDAIYLKGIASGPGPYFGHPMTYGNFVANITKAGDVSWVIQDPIWSYSNIGITYAYNNLFLYHSDNTITAITIIDPNGTYIQDCPTYPSNNNTSPYYFEFGGSDMFYLFSVHASCTGYLNALSGLKIRQVGNSFTFYTTKCILGSSTWPSFASVNNYAYVFYEGQPYGNIYNSVGKFEMRTGTSTTPIWSDIKTPNDMFSLAANSNKSYGYYFQFYLSNSTSVLNQFDQEYGTFGCFSKKDLEISLDSSEQLSSNWTIYPNPANDFLKISYSGNDIIEQVHFEIYNSTGVLVNSVKKNNLDEPETIINTSYFPGGLYILRIISNGIQIKSEKFIKY